VTATQTILPLDSVDDSGGKTCDQGGKRPGCCLWAAGPGTKVEKKAEVEHLGVL